MNIKEGVCSKVWLDLALSDLKSSRRLYDAGQYRNSYFLFQQASEKANKAFALHAGILQSSDLKKIGHDQFQIYQKSMESQKKQMNEFLAFPEIMPTRDEDSFFSKKTFKSHKESLEQGIEFIKESKNIDFVDISLKDLDSLIKELKGMKNNQSNIPESFSDDFALYLKDCADWFGNFQTLAAVTTRMELYNLLKDRERTEEMFKFLIKELVPLISSITFISWTFYFCALITIQHSSRTRYPEGGKSPEKIYTKRLPLVKKQPEFMNLLEEAIKWLIKIQTAEPVNFLGL